MKKPTKKIALVYDRVNKWGGAERVLLALNEIFPDAPLYTSVYSPKSASWAKVFPNVIPSFLQKIPLVKEKHEYIPFLMPLAFENLKLKDYDAVISVTSESAKGIITGKNTVHICYCLTPTRYLWSGYKSYFKNKTLKKLSQPIVSYLRNWDKMSAQKPDYMIAISTTVQNRIKKYYNRDSIIIHPPVETKNFKISNKRSKNFLIVGRLVPYKKVDLAIKAFNKLNLPLTVVGSGSEERYLKSIARENITFKNFVKEKELSEIYNSSKALIFPQIEDFGIVAVESHASGIPVIAFKKGGSLDTIIDGVNGIYFERQTVKSLLKSVKRFNSLRFDSKIIKNSAKRFDKKIFKKKITKFVERVTK
ncbi:MAG: glycosyltransferase [Candidatus Woesebacteria bacterium]|nr:MAG: glycosyltransferase [Candidatus Woesebacteria bacterium]